MDFLSGAEDPASGAGPRQEVHDIADLALAPVAPLPVPVPEPEGGEVEETGEGRPGRRRHAEREAGLGVGVGGGEGAGRLAALPLVLPDAGPLAREPELLRLPPPLGNEEARQEEEDQGAPARPRRRV